MCYICSSVRQNSAAKLPCTRSAWWFVWRVVRCPPTGQVLGPPMASSSRFQCRAWGKGRVQTGTPYPAHSPGPATPAGLQNQTREGQSPWCQQPCGECPDSAHDHARALAEYVHAHISTVCMSHTRPGCCYDGCSSSRVVQPCMLCGNSVRNWREGRNGREGWWCPHVRAVTAAAAVAAAAQGPRCVLLSVVVWPAADLLSLAERGAVRRWSNSSVVCGATWAAARWPAGMRLAHHAAWWVYTGGRRAGYRSASRQLLMRPPELLLGWGTRSNRCSWVNLWVNSQGCHQAGGVAYSPA